MKNLRIEKLKDDSITEFLNILDVYTVEILVIYALGQIFNDIGNNNPVVKAATVIDKLGSIVLKERDHRNTEAKALGECQGEASGDQFPARTEEQVRKEFPKQKDGDPASTGGAWLIARKCEVSK